MKKIIKKLSSKTMAILLSMAMVLNIVLPIANVYADGEGYTVTFQLESNEHTMGSEGGNITIDGEYVELRDASNARVGSASCNDGKCSITVDSDIQTELNFNGRDKFSLYNTNGHTLYTYGTKISSNQVFLVNDYVDPNNNGGNSGSQSDVEVIFDGTVNGDKVTYNVGGTDVSLTVSGASVSEGKVMVPADNLGSVIFAVDNNFNSETMQLVVKGADSYNQVLAVDSNTKQASLNGLTFPNGGLHLAIVSKGGNQNPDDPVGGEEDIDFDIKVTNTHIMASINNKTIVDDQGGNFKDTFKGTIEEAGTTDPAKTNTIHLGNPFGDAPCTFYIINGDTYDENNSNVHIDIDGGGWTITVPGAERYTIRGEGDPNFVPPRTIIWTNPDYVPVDEEDAAWVSNFKIEHATAKVIAVYDENGQQLSPSEYVNEGSDPSGLKNGFGWVKVYPGYSAVFEFVPEYGYQLTGISLNETPIAASSQMNTFTVSIPNDNNAGNVHFGAQFTRVNDVVKATSTKVSSGSINLGNTLEGGSAQLTVSDANITEAKENEFKNNAPAGYVIDDVLGIDLNNVYYKGKNDANDVWSKPVTTLENDATISIKLKEGLTADDVVIVHNIHNGSSFETINPDSYDEATNTITFKTNSFSNFAIATLNLTDKYNVEAENNTVEDNAAKKEVAKLIKEIDENGSAAGVDDDLKAALQQAITNGDTISVDVKSVEKSAADIEEDAAKVEELIGDKAKVAGYFDITIAISVDGDFVGNVTLLDKQIAITLDIPSDIPALADGYTRVYSVVRVHDGVAEKLDTTLNDDGTLTFKTDKFSTYAITYQDVKTEVNTTNSSSSNPNTNDNVMKYIVMLSVSVIGLIMAMAVVVKRKNS